MSGPSGIASPGTREGTRVVLKEITANLHNFPTTGQSPRHKSGNEAAAVKGEHQQHDIKVRFIREFAEAEGALPSTENSLSSASSFQSLTSTLSSKCSSGICVDSSPAKIADASYTSADISGLDDLISACENIRLNDKTLESPKDQSFNLLLGNGEDFSGDQTFTSAIDRTSLDRTRELSAEISPVKLQPAPVRDLDTTRNIDDETETSTANAYFECAPEDNVETTQVCQSDSQVGNVTETFVECASDITQGEGAEATSSHREDAELAKSQPVVEEVDTENKTEGFESVENRNVQSSEPILKEVPDGPTTPLEFGLEGTVESSQPKGIPVTAERSLLDVTVDIQLGNLGETEDINPLVQEVDGIEPSVFGEIEGIERLALNQTHDSEPLDLNQVSRIQPANITDVHPSGSLPDLVVSEIPSVEKLECHEPAAALSELKDISQCPSLPTLSSVCLRASLAETEVPLVEEPVAKVQSIEGTELATPSLSEKFANIAAKDVSPGSSISTVKEPTFLNAQKLEDSIEFGKVQGSPGKTVDTTANVRSISEALSPNLKTVRNAEHSFEASQVDLPELKVVEEKAEGRVNESGIAVEAEKLAVPEVEESHNCSTESEELHDKTVTIQDISAGNIFAIPESDQYAQFQPQQQSTALVLERAPTADLNKSGLVAGAGLISGDNSVSKPISLPEEYARFVPQQQSTTLTGFVERPPDKLTKLERLPTPFVTACLPPPEVKLNREKSKSPTPASTIDDRCNFEKLELAANAVANDIYNTSLELEDDISSGRFVSATSELFHDPESFDFLLSKTPRKNIRRDLRAESLYVKFDPLVSNTSMLPQGNVQNSSPPGSEERNGDNNSTLSNIGTPKRNPAIAAIDRLLFYSPMTTTTTPTSNTTPIQKTNDVQEKMEPREEISPESVNMAKELELVRATVIQLEEQVEKLKLENEEALAKQSSYQEKINQLQTQLAQEIKNKNQITVVVDEYEKSISRLVAERERDRKNLDLEKAKLQEELAAAKHHLDNTEAAFNDVHLKYERLKAVVTTYKSNELALKQSVQENVEIIKALENRYEQVKEHATTRLEKANQDLDAIRKQNESETVRLHAMLRKAELKSNSLAELVEQKTKENKELAQILDEVIARVGRNKSE